MEVPGGNFNVAAAQGDAADDEIVLKTRQLKCFVYDNWKGMMSTTLSIRNKVWVLLCLAMFAHPAQVMAWMASFISTAPRQPL